MAVHGPFVEEVKLDGVILSRIMPDEDLFKSLERIAQDRRIKRGVIISAIGSLKNVALRNVKQRTGLPVRTEDTNEIEETGPFELLCLEGNLFPSEGKDELIVHLHVMLGSPSGSVMGGHLLKATTFTTTEVIMGRIVGSSVYRAKSDLTGLMELLKR
jgi:predicted DNA-binding protein with PD1-like motif